MTNLFQIMADVDGCAGIGPVVQFIKNGVFPVIQIGIPILLILMGTIDLGKAVMSNDDKEIKGATGKLIKRAIAAVAVFFVVTLVSVVFGWLGNVNDDSVNQGAGNENASGANWFKCWKKA